MNNMITIITNFLIFIVQKRNNNKKTSNRRKANFFFFFLSFSSFTFFRCFTNFKESTTEIRSWKNLTTKNRSDSFFSTIFFYLYFLLLLVFYQFFFPSFYFYLFFVLYLSLLLCGLCSRVSCYSCCFFFSVTVCSLSLSLTFFHPHLFHYLCDWQNRRRLNAK